MHQQNHNPFAVAAIPEERERLVQSILQVDRLGQGQEYDKPSLDNDDPNPNHDADPEYDYRDPDHPNEYRNSDNDQDQKEQEDQDQDQDQEQDQEAVDQQEELLEAMINSEPT